MAIKGRTKRSQGRPVRRVTPGPRPQIIERRAPWYRAPAFLVTLAVVALAATVLAAATRVQYAWQRDDVRRFTNALEEPAGRLAAIAGSGTAGAPGFASVAELATGKLKPEELAKRAEGWAGNLGAARAQVSAITVGTVSPATGGDGTPANKVGGRVLALSGIRDAYTAGATTLETAARALGTAARAPANLRQPLAQQALALAASGRQTIDAAASLLAAQHARYNLDVSRQMPGESAGAHAERYAGAQQPGQSG